MNVQSSLFSLQLTLLLILEDKLHRQLSYDLLPSRSPCFLCMNWKPWSGLGLGLGTDCACTQLFSPPCAGRADQTSYPCGTVLVPFGTRCQPAAEVNFVSPVAIRSVH